MKFDIKKVKTCATAHEVKDGDMGWGADSIFDLKIYVEGNKDSLLFVIDEKRGASNIAFPFNSSYRYFYPYKEPTYAECQAECGLKVGDRVKVTKKANLLECGWNDMWVSEMDDVIGKVFTINKIDNQGIRFEEMGFNFPCFVLEKVQKPTYRPFANAEEFKPYRSRWVKMKGSGVTRFNYYNNNGVYNDSLEVFNYQKLFDTFLFEDGSPCGVKI